MEEILTKSLIERASSYKSIPKLIQRMYVSGQLRSLISNIYSIKISEELFYPYDQTKKLNSEKDPYEFKDAMIIAVKLISIFKNYLVDEIWLKEIRPLNSLKSGRNNSFIGMRFEETINRNKKSNSFHQVKSLDSLHEKNKKIQKLEIKLNVKLPEQEINEGMIKLPYRRVKRIRRNII